MIGCELLVRLHNTACSMFPMHKGEPFGNRLTIMLGDFNQLRYIDPPFILDVRVRFFTYGSHENAFHCNKCACQRKFKHVSIELRYCVHVSFLSPVKAKSLAHGAGVASKRHKMSITQRYGAALFRSANACVMLDESNRFDPIYAPIMERCLHSKCTEDDVKLLNSRLMGAGTSRNASSCYDGRVIAFRNKAIISRF